MENKDKQCSAKNTLDYWRHSFSAAPHLQKALTAGIHPPYLQFVPASTRNLDKGQYFCYDWPTEHGYVQGIVKRGRSSQPVPILTLAWRRNRKISKRGGTNFLGNPVDTDTKPVTRRGASDSQN
jgi:hypothetical protein